MSPERWRQIEQMYHSAAERPQDQRQAFLAEACGGDEELKNRVELLLVQDQASGVLDRPPAQPTFGGDGRFPE
jgi:hypothetical protein